MLRHLTILLLAGLLLSLPLLIFGFPPVGDLIFHYQWQASFTDQLLSGDLYPRWLLWSNRGYGSPDFLFYGPVAFYVGAVSRVFFGSDIYALKQLGASCAFALCLSGISAFMWLRSYGTNTAACIGAILYMVFPYHLYVDLYVRGAYAEFWALAWLPLILYSVRRVATQGKHGVLLAASFAMLVFTHLPTTLIFSPIAIAYGLLCCRWSNANWRRVMMLALSFVVGIALSAVYWFPAVALKKFTVSMTNGRLNYSNNFVPSLDGAGFSEQLQIVSVVALAMLAVLVISIVVLMGRQCSAKVVSRVDRDIWFWCCVTLYSIFMMSSVSLSIWKNLPILQNVQFPWRFLVVATIALPPILTKSMVHLDLRPLHILAGALVSLCLALASGMPYSKPTYWDARARIAKLTSSVETKQETLEEPWNTAGVYVFLPIWAAAFRDNLVLQPHRQIVESSAIISVVTWKAGNIRLHFSGKAPSLLTIGQFYFPGWRAFLPDGKAVSLGPNPESGLMMLDLPGGDGTLNISFDETPEMMYSRLISLFAFGGTLTLLVLATVARVQLNRHTPNIKPHL